MEVIPAIDIINGKCVRLTQGDYNRQTVYSNNPLEIAKQFEAAGIKRLHLVDLDGAKASHIVNHKVLKNISSNTSLKIDFGGGVKTDTDVELAFESGAVQVTAGSIAEQRPEIVESWLKKYGADRIILGADVLDGKIATNGWLKRTNSDLIPFIAGYVKLGVKYVICTDVSKDGLMQGPSVDTYREILKHLPNIKLIASGGVNSIEDLQQLKSIGLFGAIVGKAIYEGNILLNDLRKLD